MSNPAPEGAQDELPWSESVRALRNWFLAYLLVWIVGLAFAIGSGFDDIWILLLAIVPYIGSIVYSYRVQAQLNRSGVYKAGAWQVILGALLLNPWFLGFLIPTSVLWTTASISRKVRAGWIKPQAPRPVPDPADGQATPSTVLPLAGELPAGVRSANARAQVLLFLLSTVLVLTILEILASISQLHIINQVASGFHPHAGAAAAADSRKQFVLVLHLLAYFATVIAWLMWEYRAYSNLRLIGSRETEQTPGWAVGYWFIPVLNLIRPYNLMAELWHRSESHNDRARLLAKSGTGLLATWWLCYITAALVSRLASSFFSSAAVATDYITAMYANITAEVLMLVAAVLALRVIRGISRFQAGFMEPVATVV